MFGFAEWDSWLSFLFEASISVALLIGIMFVVRRVNANAEADRQRYLQSRKSVDQGSGVRGQGSDEGSGAGDQGSVTVDQRLTPDP